MAQPKLPTSSMSKRNRLLLEHQFREAQKHAFREELDQRVRDHEREVRRSQRVQQFRKGEPRPLDFLALGDSWFDYPLEDNVPRPPWDFGIIGEFNLKALGSPHPLIFSLAHWGWASTQALHWQVQEEFIKHVKAHDQWRSGKGPDAILASFGGDDIAGDQLAIYLTYGGHKTTADARFQGVLDLVQTSYDDLIALRDSFAPNVPIFAHCYDYPLPSGKPADNFGPWLKPSFDFALYGRADAQKVLHDMIDKFYGMLSGLAANHKDFHVVNTLGTIASNDWSNEIHPKPDGFYKLAQKFLSALQARFPGQI